MAEESTFQRLLKQDSSFYRSVSADLTRTALERNVPRAEVVDIIQEAWLKAVRHQEQFEGADIEQRLRCWLRKMVRRKVLDFLRHHDLHRSASLDAEGIDLLDDIGAEVVEAAEQAEWLATLLDKGRAGNEENDRLIRGHFLHKRSLKELAAALGVTQNAIDCRIRRHLAYLRGLAE
ncbi:MAG: sigma-70 family RNA polymerase sigma factor [Gemmataceae bacterium]